MSFLTDFQRDQIVVAQLAGASVTETFNLLGLSKDIVSKVITTCTQHAKTSSEYQNCAQKEKLSERETGIEAYCNV